MKTTKTNQQTKSAPRNPGERWQLSDEALIRILLEASQSKNAKAADLLKAA